MIVLDKKSELLLALREEWNGCTKCALHRTATSHVLFEIAVKNPNEVTRLDVLMIGEGPGNFENLMGKPFVGPAGKLLRKAIREAYIDGLVYGFTNAVACRPTDSIGGQNRQPTEEEMSKCMPRISELITIYNPRCVLCLGMTARDHVGPFIKMNGYRGLIRNLYHPSFVLRKGGEKSHEWGNYTKKLREIFREARSRP